MEQLTGLEPPPYPPPPPSSMVVAVVVARVRVGVVRREGKSKGRKGEGHACIEEKQSSKKEVECVQ